MQKKTVNGRDIYTIGKQEFQDYLDSRPPGKPMSKDWPTAPITVVAIPPGIRRRALQAAGQVRGVSSLAAFDHATLNRAKLALAKTD